MNYIFIQNNLGWIIPLVILDGILKLFALWKSARQNQLAWFIALGVINSLGILPAVYLLFFQHYERKNPSLT